MQAPEIALRAATTDDVPFILDSWMKSWRSCPWSGCIRNDQYYEVTRHAIEGLIGRGAVLTVACVASRPDLIIGWVCHEPHPEFALIHYLYVKDPYVRYNIARDLVDSVPGRKPGAYTYRYRQVTEACQGWRHIPEIARRERAVFEPRPLRPASDDSRP